jgi:hypothetical protein
VRRPALTLTLVAAVLAGCGNARTPVPDVTTPDPPAGTRVVEIPEAGLRFTAPANWRDVSPLGRSAAGGVQSKTATIAVWVYPRTEPLPATRRELQEVQGLLLDRVKQRDPGFVPRSSAIERRGGARAIELVGRESIGGRPFGVRSAHVFAHGRELVVDAYARPEHFDGLDASVFGPLLRSLTLTRPGS